MSDEDFEYDADIDESDDVDIKNVKKNVINDEIAEGKKYTEHSQEKLYNQFSSRLNFGLLENHFVDKSERNINRNLEKQRSNRPGKDYRRTEEQVIDNRTKDVLLKLMKRKIIDKIYGCICTGKEGNIYIGTKGEGSDADWPETFAIKIYKTSVLKFKDRKRYIEGELRFKNHSSSKNSRKAVILWAEKEFRNLHRLYKEGVKCPKPLMVKQNVLLMELITEGDKPAPQLRVANFDFKDLEYYYFELCMTLRYIYHHCKLVHADLSEYNLLVKNKEIYFIDVGQSVEFDNPNSNIFLRKDISVITKFFGNRGVKTVPLMRLFEFIVEDKLLTDDRAILEECIKVEETMSHEEFLGYHIPQRLADISDPEQEFEDLFNEDYERTFLHSPYTGIILTEIAHDPWEEKYSDEEEEEEDQEEEEDKTEKQPDPTLNRKNYSKAEWKELQKSIRVARKEKRKTKTPKYIKRKAYRKKHPNAK